MPDWLPPGLLDNVGAPGIAIFFAGLVITDKLVWHKRLKAEATRADRWEAIALDALRTGAHAGVHAAEVSSEVLSNLPDPSRRGKK